MRLKSTFAVALAATLLAIPVGAAIKAMTLRELMQVTHEAVQGKIIGRETVRLNHPWEGAVYTQLTIEGESLRTGEKKTYEVVFHGSHETEDWYGVSTMPSLQDSRLGGETLVFFAKHPLLPGKSLISNSAGMYRLELGFGAEKILMGKGEGAAFATNTKLTDVRKQVLVTHADLARVVKTPGLSK
jgi:hypothetical protein